MVDREECVFFIRTSIIIWINTSLFVLFFNIIMAKPTKIMNCLFRQIRRFKNHVQDVTAILLKMITITP